MTFCCLVWHLYSLSRSHSREDSLNPQTPSSTNSHNTMLPSFHYYALISKFPSTSVFLPLSTLLINLTKILKLTSSLSDPVMCSHSVNQSVDPLLNELTESTRLKHANSFFVIKNLFMMSKDSFCWNCHHLLTFISFQIGVMFCVIKYIYNNYDIDCKLLTLTYWLLTILL